MDFIKVGEKDGLIILSPDNAEMKESLSELAMKSGKPCFIDKTFTTDYESGKRIFDLAEKHNTPVYTTSALRYAPDYDQIDASELVAIDCFGPNDFDIYSIHMFEPLMGIVKKDAKRVMYISAEGYYTLRIEFADGMPASICGHMDKRFPYMMLAAEKNAHKVVKAVEPFWPVFTEALCNFFMNKEIPVDHKESLAIMAMRTAGLKAMEKPNEWVDVEYKVF